MKFIETPLKGAFVIDVAPVSDDRGFFARIFDAREFADRGLDLPVDQFSVSFNAHRGTLRGMHFQKAPYSEAKLVRCTAGAIFDVVVDLRRSSKTYLKWHGVELTAKNHRVMFVPKGFAHGFQTLQDESEVLYQISPPYQPESSTGFRWDDAQVGIEWPLAVSRISPRDCELPIASFCNCGFFP